MSLGVNLLAALVKRVAKTLDDEFDIEIFEMHHNKKIDAPSGTALLFARRPRRPRYRSRGRSAAHAMVTRVPQGRPHRLCEPARRHRGGRTQRDLCRAHERIELVHKAEDRMIFARGAVKAALWRGARSPGCIRWPTCLAVGYVTEAKRNG